MKKVFFAVVISIFALGLIGDSVAQAATTQAVTVNATVSFSVPSSISVSPATMTYDTLASRPTGITQAPNNSSPGKIRVTYDTNAAAWTVRVWVDNKPGSTNEALPGLYSSSLNAYVGQKIWCANFGPTGKKPKDDPPPSPNKGDGTPDDTVWNGGDNANWFYWAEKDSMTSDPYTWRRLSWTAGKLDSPFDTYIAGDFRMAAAGTYTTTTYTYEIVNQ